jgi:hypothetical protein
MLLLINIQFKKNKSTIKFKENQKIFLINIKQYSNKPNNNPKIKKYDFFIHIL